VISPASGSITSGPMRCRSSWSAVVFRSSTAAGTEDPGAVWSGWPWLPLIRSGEAGLSPGKKPEQGSDSLPARQQIWTDRENSKSNSYGVLFRLS
jgi:hypothetical protein